MSIPRLVRVERSDNVFAFGYDAPTRKLYVQFRDHQKVKPGDALQSEVKGQPIVYQYEDVPPEIAHGFGGAHSPGGYLANKIKGKFVFSKLALKEADHAETSARES